MTMTVVIALVQVLALSLCLSDGVSAFTPSVTYVSFMAPQESFFSAVSPINPAAITRSEVIISDSDDTPIIEVKLPVVFPYFGDFIDRIYVTPNGYVQTTAAALTSPSFADPCSFSFEGVIAGFLADLTTFTPSHVSNVSVLQDNTVTSIQYRKLNNWGYIGENDTQYDFDINLYPDGTVSIYYDDITPLEEVDSKFRTCDWLTGLVSSNFTTATGRGATTEDQDRIQSDIWGTSTRGVYPAVRDDVKSHNRFIACPVSNAWCATPASINSSTVHVNITSLSIGCIFRPADINSTINIAVQIESSASPTFSIDLSRVARCSTIDSGSSSTSAPVAFQCDLTGINFTTYLSLGTIYLHILWKPEVSIDSYSRVGETVPAIAISYDNVQSSVNSCALNKDMGSCSECDVCNSHVDPSSLTCLSLSCSNSTSFVTNASFSTFSSSDNLKSLYASPSCSESCALTFVEQVDNNNECCHVDDIDCMGYCNGGAMEGRNGNSEESYAVCCKETEPPDCLGLCGGEAVIDTCNVCNGNDTGIKCPTGFEVDTGYNFFNSNNHLATSYDASNATYSSLVPITVTNTFNTSVFVYIYEIEKDIRNGRQYGPVFDLPPDIHEIIGYANYTFYVASNVSGIFSNDLYGWEVKTLSIK